MDIRNSSIEDFVKRLAEISEHDGTPYGRAHLLFDKEEEHERACLQYKGYLALSDAFKCFFLETVELSNADEFKHTDLPSLSEYYSIYVPRISHCFMSLCGAERVGIRGYPLQGCTILRNVFDNLVFVSATLQGIADFRSIEGLRPGESLDFKAVKKLRKKTEHAVRRKMIGDESGLSQEARDEITLLNEMYDLETHGARLSQTLALGWMKGKSALWVVPQFEQAAFAMFMNRYCEVAWMAHRLFPAIQTPGASFPEAWNQKWEVLDDSFARTIESLTKSLGKNIGRAFVEFMHVKFPFTAKSSFPLGAQSTVTDSGGNCKDNSP